MTTVLHSLLIEVFNSCAKNISFEDFTHWLLNGEVCQDSSMIYQLLNVSRQGERLAAQVDRSKERTRQRKNEKESVQSGEATSAFTNMIDNRVEEFLSLVFAMAPLEPLAPGEKNTSQQYTDWLCYLQKQFLALSYIDQHLPEGAESVICAKDGDDDDDGEAEAEKEERFIVELLALEENERNHIALQQAHNGFYSASVDQIRSLLLFRIQNCLLSRAVTGVFVDHVPFLTDHSAMLSAVATGRFLAAHCTNGLRRLHDAEEDGKAKHSYSDLLQFLSSNNATLDNVVGLPKSGFPMQYTKKSTDAFKTLLVKHIREFEKYYNSLSKKQQEEFRKESLAEKKTSTRPRVLRVKKAKKSDDDDNDDEDEEQDEEDDKPVKEPPQKRLCATLPEKAPASIFSTTTTRPPSSLFDDPHDETMSLSRFNFNFGSPTSMLNDHTLFSASSFGRNNGSTMQSPRAFTAARNLRLEDESEHNVLPVRSAVETCECKKLRQTVLELHHQLEQSRTASTTDRVHGDISAFFTDNNVFSNDTRELERQLQTARNENAEQLFRHEEQVATLRQQQDSLVEKLRSLEETQKQSSTRILELESALRASQQLQISTQNARMLAERENARLVTKKSQPLSKKSSGILQQICNEWLTSL